MRINIYRLLIGSEIQFGQLLFNCIAVVFQCRCLCHMSCVEFTLVALLCSHCGYLIGIDVRRPDCHEDAYCRERTAFCGMQFPAVWSWLSDVVSSWLGAVASTRRLVVHNWINNLLHFTQVFNIVISLSSTSHYYRCLCVIVMCIYTIITEFNLISIQDNIIVTLIIAAVTVVCHTIIYSIM